MPRLCRQGDNQVQWKEVQAKSAKLVRHVVYQVNRRLVYASVGGRDCAFLDDDELNAMIAEAGPVQKAHAEAIYSIISMREDQFNLVYRLSGDIAELLYPLQAFSLGNAASLA